MNETKRNGGSLPAETERICAELTAVLRLVPEETIRRAADAAAEHGRVFVCGAGRSGLMLRAFAMRLAQMGKTVYVVGETVTPAIGRGDLLILASASGTTAGVCLNAETAQRAGAELFVITASARSPLTALHPADVLIPAGTKDGGAGEQIMGSLFEQALLIFLDSAMLRLSVDAAQMRARHANLE